MRVQREARVQRLVDEHAVHGARDDGVVPAPGAQGEPRRVQVALRQREVELGAVVRGELRLDGEELVLERPDVVVLRARVRGEADRQEPGEARRDPRVAPVHGLLLGPSRAARVPGSPSPRERRCPYARRMTERALVAVLALSALACGGDLAGRDAGAADARAPIDAARTDAGRRDAGRATRARSSWRWATSASCARPGWPASSTSPGRRATT
ncbi:MAG: hypothetical protein M5U28_25900 [Sandaracinaceae bacterium]|nr:hypothetical protein [Sandaracinaceae bacterium]